jgi:hypothetical protein
MLILYVGCIKFFTNRFVKNFCPVLNITFLAYIIFLFSPRVKNIYKNYLFMFKDNYKLLSFFFLNVINFPVFWSKMSVQIDIKFNH